MEIQKGQMVWFWDVVGNDVIIKIGEVITISPKGKSIKIKEPNGDIRIEKASCTGSFYNLYSTKTECLNGGAESEHRNILYQFNKKLDKEIQDCQKEIDYYLSCQLKLPKDDIEAIFNGIEDAVKNKVIYPKLITAPYD